jgi:ubiquinone/menaquinone biosynthesis C-methylase UbiE
LTQWVFDNISKENNLKVLELGCGNGLLWRLNAKRVPGTWEITLSDFSVGMIHDAKNTIGDSIKNITYEVINIEHIPFEDHSYDLIIANNMLYHVPDRNKALSEIQRVLKKNGTFYATTFSKYYMKEMKEIISEYRAKPVKENATNDLIQNFSIEDGGEQLKKYFNNIVLKPYDNILIINEAEPFINFIYSTVGIQRDKIIFNEDEREPLTEFVKNIIERKGNISIPANSGLFICKNSA